MKTAGTGKMQENEALRLAREYIEHTGTHVFLTGKAGTGKTTFLKQLREDSPKRMIVTAPTGVAAINAGGVTIHSFFQLPFGPQILTEQTTEGGPKQVDMNRFSRDKVNILRSLDLLVIDEVSMVRADLLDGIDRVLRRYRRRSKPFGGIQLLLIGDLQQLAPVVKDDEWNLLKNHYETPYFFSSKALSQTPYVCIELKHIYRQQDERFIHLLNQIRDNNLDAKGEALLNSRYLPDFEPDPDEGYITLTTHNRQANLINEQKLSLIDEPAVVFHAEISGNFPEYSYPTDVNLKLKPGAQVMYARNDVSREKRYYNGKIGTIVSMDEELVYVRCSDGEIIATESVEWHNYTYTIDPETEEIRENLIGTFKQMPLKLAWAITIHKSQGLTFDNVVIDAHSAFAHGQVYVALSRCRTIEGMVLRTPIDARSLRSDQQVRSFLRTMESNRPDQNDLALAMRSFERNLLLDLLDFTSLRQRLETILRSVREHEAQLAGNPLSVCQETTNTFRSDVQDVAFRFVRQMERLLAENADTQSNQALQDRLKKACNYFREKVVSLYETFFDRFVLECDNQAVRKALLDATGRLDDEFRFKAECLIAVSDGFSVQAYLQARAKAGLDRSKMTTRTNKDKTAVPTTRIKPKNLEDLADSGMLHPVLYGLLKDWRLKEAHRYGKAAFSVLPNTVLQALSNTLPSSLPELKSIKGFGDVRIKRHGAELLGMIADYCEQNGIYRNTF